MIYAESDMNVLSHYALQTSVELDAHRIACMVTGAGSAGRFRCLLLSPSMAQAD